MIKDQERDLMLELKFCIFVVGLYWAL